MKRCVPSAKRAMICAVLAVSCERAPASTPSPVTASGPLPPGQPQVRATAVVTSREGKVELQRGPQGGWADAQVGDRLAPSDALRTQVGEAEVGVNGVKMRVHVQGRGPALLFLFGVLLWRSFRIALLSKDAFGTYLAAGIVSMFAIQMFVNIGMTLGIMPITGIPLPFVSYGGSSLIANYAAVGLLMNVHMRRFK